MMIFFRFSDVKKGFRDISRGGQGMGPVLFTGR